jgi:alginate O-acetyltransferase complex protein AlgI
LVLLTLGLFEKIVLADGWMAPVADEVFNAVARQGTLSAWTGTLAFSAQIFFDFAGYSTCAIGIALTMGFSLPDNFRAPYAAVGFSDFWRRWHISLSSWLRDYLYIPLGGNRKGTLRTYANLMITMLLGGLWHGASWRFVAWGGLHGLYLAVERWIRSLPLANRVRVSRVTAVGVGALTYFLVLVTWVFFRAQSFGDAWTLLQSMFGQGNPFTGFSGQSSLLVVLVTAGMLCTHMLIRRRSLEEVWGRLGWVGQTLVLAAMLTAILTNPGADRAFIYFQF